MICVDQGAVICMEDGEWQPEAFKLFVLPMIHKESVGRANFQATN